MSDAFDWALTALTKIALADLLYKAVKDRRADIVKRICVVHDILPSAYHIVKAGSVESLKVFLEVVQKHEDHLDHLNRLRRYIRGYADNLSFIRYCFANRIGTPFSSLTLNRALKFGRYDLFVFYTEECDIPLDECSLACAIRSKDMKLIKIVAKKHQYPFCELDFSRAIQMGRIDIVEFLHATYGPFSENIVTKEALQYAVWRRKTTVNPLMVYLVETLGCVYTSWNLRDAEDFRAVGTVRYLHEKGVPWPSRPPMRNVVYKYRMRHSRGSHLWSLDEAFTEFCPCTLPVRVLAFCALLTTPVYFDARILLQNS